MHQRISINSICLLPASLEQQAQHWRELAATRVSLVGPQLDDEGLAAAERALAGGDYILETLMHPFSPQQTLNPDPDSWQQPRSRLMARIEQARQLGAKSIYMTSGGHGSLTWEQAAQIFADAVAPCVKRARDAGIQLMIENAPPAYADMHIAHSLRDTVALAELAEIGVLIDLPGCWTEAGLDTSMRRALPRCGLVQISDYVCGDRGLPARAVPGDGDMPLQRLLGWLLEAGYEGAFELELVGPRIDGEGHVAATRRAATQLGELLRSLGI